MSQENVDLNELVKELYDKIGSKKEFKIITLEANTIFKQITKKESKEIWSQLKNKEMVIK